MVLGLYLRYRAPDRAEGDLLTASAHPLSLPGGPLQAEMGDYLGSLKTETREILR